MSSCMEEFPNKFRSPWKVVLRRPLLLQLLPLLLILPGFFSFTVFGSTLHSVPELEAAMYQNIYGTPCVRLLNLTGEIGCANPGRDIFQAPVQRFADSEFNLSSKTAVLLPASALHQVLDRTVRDPWMGEHVAAVLVEFGMEEMDNSSDLNLRFSPDSRFPQAEFAPYKVDYIWNEPGSGILQQQFNFPVFLLSNESTATARQVASINENHNLEHPLHVAEFDFVMQTTKSGTHDSESCLKEWSCLPLGGYSVWSSVSPINTSAPLDRPIVLIVSSMDSASFFRDMTIGADSSLSGMIAMLAAVDALSKVVDIDHLKKEVVFLVLTGEAWGYLGSRRFLAELAAENLSVAGLDASRIHQVLEIGSIGQALNSGTVTLYAHKQGSQISVSTGEILDALQLSANSLSRDTNFESVEVKLADVNNPGIPPSSLMAFLQKDESVSGVVLEEFDKVFSNHLYHSHFDDDDNLNVTAVSRTAALLARSVYILGNSTANSTSLEAIEVNNTLVTELVSCLLSHTPPGMTCDLVTSLITPTQKFANHYVGVLLGRPSATPYLENVDDTARFIFNFLASRTGRFWNQSSNGNAEALSQAEECTQTCSRVGEVCVGSTGQKKGYCILSTTRFVPAYSPRLHYNDEGWRLTAVEPGDTLSEVDPVWTESFWKSSALRLYLKESSRHDETILLVGFIVIFGSLLSIVTTKAVFLKRIKQA